MQHVDAIGQLRHVDDSEGAALLAYPNLPNSDDRRLHLDRRRERVRQLSQQIPQRQLLDHSVVIPSKPLLLTRTELGQLMRSAVSSLFKKQITMVFRRWASG